MDVTTIELDFLCDHCGRPVADHEGCLVVFFTDLAEYRRAESDWQCLQTESPQATGSALTETLTVPWRIQHDSCSPAREANGYDVDVSKVRTWRALLLATSELMTKNWLMHTDWPQVIGAAAEGRSRRIIEHSQGDAA